MHTGRRYQPKEFFIWTFSSTMALLIYVSVPTILYHFGFKFISIPWQLIAILGTALSFIVGFKNNASYSRIWEARQIYGGIINSSRSFGYTLRDVVGDQEIVKKMFYRHFAWLTALRFQLREPRSWENMTLKSNKHYQENNYVVPEWEIKLDEILKTYLSPKELAFILTKKNNATQLSAMQSAELAEMKRKGIIDAMEWTQLQTALSKLTDDQGRAERIKNFPYPRNFASITTYLMFIFIIFLPFGLLKEFAQLDNGTFMEGYSLWLNIPLTATVAWAFHVLDTIGESSVNPFEGSANDVPITQISRTIEIDMRDMLGEMSLPPAIVSVNNIVM